MQIQGMFLHFIGNIKRNMQKSYNEYAKKRHKTASVPVAGRCRISETVYGFGDDVREMCIFQSMDA